MAGQDVTLILADLATSGKYSAFYDAKYGKNLPELVITLGEKTKTTHLFI